MCVASKKARILWGMTGSVAVIRAPIYAKEFLELGEVEAVVSERARHFLDPLPASIRLHTDDEEWSLWRKLGDPVLHIELRKWADVFVIAPLSADSLAKIANGICDNLLLSVARAWDFSKPLVLAPAMNTLMWQHPVTRRQIEIVASWGATIVDPVAKTLACADVGIGALADPVAVRRAIEQAIL